jgi:DNA-binding response OmpR family regulator
MRILLVESDAEVADLLQFALHRAGHAVVVARTEAGALQFLSASAVELVLTNTTLSSGSGWAVCAAVRAASSMPVVFLTNATGEEEIVRGYELGADLYLTTPIGMRHLRAALGAVARRHALGEPPAER